MIRAGKGIVVMGTDGDAADLIVVVDPKYGSRLDQTVQLAPVWIVGTQGNDAAITRNRRGRSSADHRGIGTCTSFEVPDGTGGLDTLLGILPVLEIHYGELRGDCFQFADGFTLDVHGLALEGEGTDGLRQFGFSRFTETPNGFRARRALD